MTPATVSPRTVTAVMTPNNGRLAAKFRVPSTGSTMKANSASAMVSSSAGSLCALSSPITTAPGKVAVNAAAITASAASSASVTRSKADDFRRICAGASLRNRGMISVEAASARISPTR
jgi:hypothetical protein